MRSVYSHQVNEERIMYMHFELAGKWDAVTFVAEHTKTGCIKNAELKLNFLTEAGGRDKWRIDSDERMYVCTDG